jgi:outer membrane protein TolC
MKTLLLPISLLFGLSANAQTVLTLDEAIRLGKENSPIARQIAASFESNRWQYVATQALRKPQVVLNGNTPGYSRQIVRVQQPDGSFLFRSVSQAFSSLTLSLEQPIIATGGTLSINTALSRQDLFNSPTPFLPWQSNPFFLQLTQPLLQFNVTKWRFRQQQLAFAQATQQQLEQLEALSVDVTQRFFNLYLAKLQLRNAELNRASNDTIYRVAKGRYGLGKIAENDLLQVELSFTNARNAVEQQTLAIQVAERELQNLTGPIGSGSGFDVLPPAHVPAADPDVQTALAEAKANRSDYLAFALQENQALRAVKEAEAARRINGQLTVSYGLNQAAANLPEVYQNPLSAQFANVGFTLPIATFGRNKANYEAARFGLEAQQRQNEADRNSLEINVYNAVLQLKQLRTSLEISAKSDTIAQKRFEVAKNRYGVGKVDITNLLIAQQDKDAALLAYIRTLQQYWTAHYTLRRLTLYDFEARRKIGK